MSNKWKWMRGTRVIIIILLMSTKAGAQTSPIDLKKAIQMALTNNQSLKADSMNIVVASHQVEVVKSALKPQVNYSSRMEYNPAIPTQLLPGEAVGQPGKEYVGVQFGTRYNMGSSLEVNQNIYKKETRYKVQSAELDRLIARTRHNMSREELVFAVVNTFFGLQAKAESIRTTEKDLRNLQDITRVAKAQVENGVLKRIDYESLQINTANKESQLRQLQADYNDMLTYFKYLAGVSPDEPVVIDQTITDVTNTAEYLTNEVSKREDVKLYRQLIQSKELELKTIHSERLPVITSYFKFSYQSQFNKLENAYNNDFWFKSSSIGITASVPLFDGNRRKNRMRIAESQLTQLNFSDQNQKQLAKTEQVQAWEKLSSDQDQYRITLQNLELAEKVFISRRALYTEGVSSLIELLDAEKELTQSRQLYTQALIDVKASLVNVHKANGTLLTDFVNQL